MKKIFYLLIIPFYACTQTLPTTVASSETSTIVAPPPLTAQQLREQLQQTEKSRPLDYLSVSSISMDAQKKQIRHATWFREATYEDDGYLYVGKIQNKASIAKFKDVLIKFTYISNTNSEISSEQKRVYQYFQPSSTTDFNFKLYPPADYAGLDVSIISAKSSN